MRLFAGVMVHTESVVDVSVTASPELAVAPDANGVALNGVAPGFANVIVCAAAAIFRVTACVAAGLTPLDAVTVKLKVPDTVAGPVRTPVVGLRDIPVGSKPTVTTKVGAGAPVAVNVCVYAAFTTPAGGAALVKAGAADNDIVIVGLIGVVTEVVKQFAAGTAVSTPAVAGFKLNTYVALVAFA